MANTTNLNMTKLAGTEKQKTFPSTFNGNMDAIDGAFGAGFGVSGKPTVNAEINSLADGLAIISNNNTHAAITAGQFVYVRGHSSLSDGLYVATSNISANGTLSGSNLTADSSGGLNSVYASLNSKLEGKMISTASPTVQQLKDAKLVIVFLNSSDGTQHGAASLMDYYWNSVDLGVWTGSQYQHTYCQIQWDKTNGSVTIQTNYSERGQDVTVSISYYILLM